tara:strand:- start:2009 stop:3142 length:1134 start_codon:yes stop_codon:yes gene_type:complete
MAIVKSRSGNKKINISSGDLLKAVRVLDIILDINHPLAEEYGNYDSIGTIFYTEVDENTPKIDPKVASTASPLFSHLKYYPLINEIVLVLPTNDKNIINGKQKTTYYLPQINIHKHPHHNATPSIKNVTSEKKETKYRESELGAFNKESLNDITLGQYFKEQSNIKPLLAYEGDMILEGRFGNSIRFGSTNNSNNISNPNTWSDSGDNGNPITIIRNGQSSNLDEKGWLPTVENIGEDASNIYLTSNQRIKTFKQASPYMESFDAIYIKPQTLEQALLNPQEAIYKGVDNPVTTDVPLYNEDIDLNIPISSNAEEIDELQEVIDNKNVTNESENMIENQIINKDSNVTLPNFYINPDPGGNSTGGGPGISEEFEITD